VVEPLSQNNVYLLDKEMDAADARRCEIAFLKGDRDLLLFISILEIHWGLINEKLRYQGFLDHRRPL
jgi:hypothetical protein